MICSLVPGSIGHEKRRRNIDHKLCGCVRIVKAGGNQ
jgi:hypothetical protein